jgi:hypothetical protein
MQKNPIAIGFAILFIPVALFLLMADFQLLTRKRSPGDTNTTLTMLAVYNLFIATYYYWFLYMK